MKIHEFQAKELFARSGIAVPIGRVATTVDEAVAAVAPLIAESGNPVVVLKSQIHAGGRGKGRFKEHPEQAVSCCASRRSRRNRTLPACSAQRW